MRRTQIYLDEAQRKELDRLAEHDRVSMAELIRRAVDQYLRRSSRGVDRKRNLAETFGALPNLEVPPRSEWDRGYG